MVAKILWVVLRFCKNMAFCGGMDQASTASDSLETGLQPLLVRENEYSLTVCWRLMAVTREMTDKLPVTQVYRPVMDHPLTTTC